MIDNGSVPHVCVVVAFYHPAMTMALRQIESLAQQEGVKLSCVAVLDGRETAKNDELAESLSKIGATLVRTPEAKGVRAAFARGLEAALNAFPDPSTLFAYCDQDDVWHPQKLRRSADCLRVKAASLVHCDARVMDDAGLEISGSLHRFESRSETSNFIEVLLLNNVTGMTAVFNAEVAQLALEVMRTYDGELLHDHITAVAAALIGDVVFLDDPLVDYVQHGDNRIGAKPHRSAWRRRMLGLSHLSLYRQTSRRLFDERQTLCSRLGQLRKLPACLDTMFVNDRAKGSLRVLPCYATHVTRLMAKGQFRRAMLCLRMLDAALSRS